MIKLRTKLIFLCLGMIVILLCVNKIGVQAVGTGELKGRVLFISSYSYGRATVRSQIEGLENGRGKGIVLDYEFMDTARVDDETAMQQFYEGISYRLSQVEPYDVVILGDDAALLFAMEYREELFEGIPLVYEGINDEELALELSRDPLITGVVEKTSLEENINFGLTLYPSAQRVVVIMDDSVTGEAVRKSFYECAEKYPELSFEEINCSSLKTNELRQRIKQLRKDDILIYVTMSEDASGKKYSDEEAVRLIRNNAGVPALRVVESGIGEGFLGGNVVSMYRSGEIAMNIALDIIGGKRTSDIKAIEESPNVFCVDELIMKEYGFSLSLIPEGAVIINHQPTFWERNKEVLIPGGILVIALLAVIGWVVIDNVKRRKLMEELEGARSIMESASQHDFLTGLPNRSKLMIDLEELIASGTPCTIMMLDIDHFKHINDTYGHTAGDEALKQLAGRMKERQSPIQTPYRYAGDEFIIILKSNQKKIVEEQAFQCSQLFKKPFVLAGEKKQVGGSIGISSYPTDADNVEQLINNADEAMYEVKKTGRNHFAFYHAIGREN